MRIIGGSRRGKKLHSPRDLCIRPTADRVRESVFNIICDHISGAHVLDLFAGTGAMGMEALSRGAAHAVFIDNHPTAIKLIEKNIADCRWTAQANIIRWDIARNLNCIKSPTDLYNLIFIDPPYPLKLTAKALKHLECTSALAEGAKVIVEHARTDLINTETTAFKLEDQRPYGKTLVSFLRYVI